MSGVQSIERAFAVLRRLANGPAGVTDLAERVDLPKSTVSRILSTLETLGAVQQITPGGPYRIGDLVQELANGQFPARNLVELARPHLVELMEATGEATGISVLDGTDVHYLDQVESRNAVQVRDWTGTRIPLHVVPSGLVMLAYASEERQRAYLEGPLEQFTAHSVIETAAIRARLKHIKQIGYAWVYEEYSDGINSVAAPLRDAAGIVVAAIHSHGPAYRFPIGDQTADRAARAQTIAETLLSITGRIEAALQTGTPLV